MKPYHRRKAISKHPEYQRDYSAFQDVALSFKGDNDWLNFYEILIMYKWKLEYPIPKPKLEILPSRTRNLLYIGNAPFEDEGYQQIKEGSRKKVKVGADKEHGRLPYRSVLPLFTKEGTIEIPLFNHIPFKKKRREAEAEGKHLYISIDLTQPKTVLLHEIEEIIDIYQGQLRLSKKSSNPTDSDFKYDPWLIYDLKTFYRLSYIKIAQGLTGINKNPTYNNEIKECYDALSRAFNFASKMIQLVDREKEYLCLSFPYCPLSYEPLSPR